MENIAQLGIKVDSSGIKQATNELSKLTNQSGKTESSIMSLRNVFASIGAGALAKQFIDTSDKLNLLDARLKLATSSVSEFKSQQEKLLQISLQSYTAISDTVTLFTKLNPALKQVGASTEQVNSVVSSFVKGLQLGGSSAAEASSAILQFSQAMGSGVLRGEEFNTIAEASPKLMSYLAKGMGVAQGELRKMAADGELTASRVSNALLKVKDSIDKDFATLPVTVAKAMTNLSTATSIMIQDIDKTLGATNALSGYITQLSDAINSLSPEELQEIVDLVKNSAIAFGTAATAITVAKGAMTLYTSATNGAFTATTLLKGALNTIPFAIIVTGITAIATSLFSASEASDTLEKTLKSTNEELTKLTKNQIAYRKELLQEEIITLRLEAANARANAAKNSASLEDKARADEANKKLNEALKTSRELSNILTEQTSKVSSTQKTPLIEAKTVRNEAELIKLAGTELQKFNLTLDETANKMKKAGATDKEINDYRIKATQEFNDKHKETIAKAIADIKQFADDSIKAYQEIVQIGMSEYEKSLTSINERYQTWIAAGVDINTALAAQLQLVDELNAQTLYETLIEDLSYYEKKVQLQSDSLSKELELQGIAYANAVLSIENSDKTIEQKEKLIALETELYDLSISKLEEDSNTEFQDTLLEFQDEALQRQLDLNDAINDFAGSFDGVPKSVANVSKAILGMSQISIKAKKDESSMNAKYTKEFIKYADDEIKTKELVGQYEKDNGELKQSNNAAEIAGYANLAGAMSTAFTEGSAGAKAFQTIQATLGIVNGYTAISTAWASAPFPANLPAVAAATAGVLPIIAQLSSLGGSSGGGSTPSFSQQEIDKFNIEATYDPMIDKLDRQIELLESIDKNGSAAKIGVDLAANTFTRDYALFVNEAVNELHSSLNNAWQARQGTSGSRQATEAALESYVGVDFAVGNGVNDAYTIDKNALSDAYSFMRLIQAANTELVRGTDWEVLFDKDWKKAGSPYAMMTARIADFTNQFQDLLHKYTISLLDSMDELKSAKDDFKGFYDDITGSSFFANKDLTAAFGTLEKYLNGTSLTDYLITEIDNIEKLESFLTEDKINTLLLQDPTKLEEQLDIIEDLREQTGLTFENGAEDALNYLDAIELVSEAMTTSTSNIKSFYDSFKTDNELAQSLATQMGETLATTYDELAALFVKLENDTLGLTDADLKLLESNISFIERLEDEQLAAQNEALQAQKDHLQDKLDAENDYYNTITSSIRSITSILSTLDSAIEKLRGASETSETSLNKFYQSMAETQSLMGGNDYDAIKESLSKTVGYSSVLMSTKNFASQEEMAYAQQLAANQLEDMDLTLNDELDYLEKIEENTRNTVAALTKSITNIGTQISDSINNIQTYSDISEKVSESVVTNSFKSVLGITPDTSSSGYQYWVNELANNPSITAENLDISIARGAKDSSHIMAAMNWASSNNIGQSLLDFYYNNGTIGNYEANDILDMFGIPSMDYQSSIKNMFDYNTFKAMNSGLIVPFANGGIVTSPTLGLIGEAGYSEAVIPLKNPNDPLNQAALIGEVRALRSEVAYLNTLNEKQTATQIKTLSETRMIKGLSA